MDSQLTTRSETLETAAAGLRSVLLRESRRPQIDVLEVMVDELTMAETVDRCRRAIEDERYLGQVSVNAVQLMSIRRDAALRDLTHRDDILVSADGLPIVWVSRMLGVPLPERVPGIDLMVRLLQLSADRGYRVYFLGSKPEVVETMVRSLERTLPTLEVAGYHHGYVADEQADEVLDEIARIKPDLLFVGTGSPNQEQWVDRVRGTGVKVALAVGGSFDVLSGTKTRAPAVWQRLGLEWLYRLFQEPGRYARRYAECYPAFAALALRSVLRQRLGFR